MKLNTDKDVIERFKSMMMQGRVSVNIWIVLNIRNDKGHDVYKYNYGTVDDMITKLFDASLLKRVNGVIPYFGGLYCLGDNGQPNAACGFELTLAPSHDGSTNITSRLIDFLSLVVNPHGLERLKEPFRQNMVERYFDMQDRVVAKPYNPWEDFDCD